MHKLFFFSIILLMFSFTFWQKGKNRIDRLMEQPFDLQQFKKKKHQSNSGGANARDFYFRPAEKGMYYHFFLFNLKESAFIYLGDTAQKRSLTKIVTFDMEIITYKPLGKYQHDYLDPTETLIEWKSKVNDKDLLQLSFIGLDSMYVKQQLGSPDLRKEGCFIYTHRDRALILNVQRNRVNWLKYLRLNKSLQSDSVPAELLKY